ncbi:MAG: hypothetical protein ACJAVZ_002593 [Afipia broomeae]|jgi:hypothetical protein
MAPPPLLGFPSPQILAPPQILGVASPPSLLSPPVLASPLLVMTYLMRGDASA